MSRTEVEAELCGLLDDEALRLLTVALRGVLDSPEGFGSVKLIVTNRMISAVDVKNTMKAKRNC